MKTFSLQIVVLVIGTFGHPILAQASNSVEATQIISIDGGSFRLDVDRLKQVFGTEDMKDRHVIVVSIAGPYRTGKSFLLSFFLKYLYAKVCLSLRHCMCWCCMTKWIWNVFKVFKETFSLRWTSRICNSLNYCFLVNTCAIKWLILENQMNLKKMLTK